MLAQRAQLPYSVWLCLMCSWYDAFAPAGHVRTKASVGPSEEVSEPKEAARSPAVEFQVFNFGCLVRVLHAAALRWLPGAVAPCSRGEFTQCGVRGRGAAERFWQGYNKPANLSAWGRGYRWDTIRY